MSWPITSYKTRDGVRYMARPMIQGARRAKGGFESKALAREWIVEQRRLARTGGSLYDTGTVGAFLDHALKGQSSMRLDRRKDRELSKSSREQLDHVVRWWTPRIGSTRLCDVNRRTWDQWCQILRDELEAKSSTRRRYAALLLRTFSWGCETGYLAINPLARSRIPFEMPEKRHRILTRGTPDSEWERMREYLNEPGREELAWFVWLYLGAGLRRKEIMSLRVRDVQASAGTVYVQPSKNGHARTLDLPPPAVPFFEKLSDGKGPDDTVLGRYWPRKPWYSMLKNLQLGGLRPHDLRHTFGTWMLEDEQDTDVREQMAILGHSTPKTTMEYARWVKGSRSPRTRRLQDRMAR